MLEEKQEAVAEIEREMDEEYDYKALRNEATALSLAIRDFMVKNDRKKLEMDGYRWQVIRPVNRVWNADKLRGLVGKSMFFKLCRFEPDSDKIDAMVREGKLNIDDIQDALDELPKSAYIKRYQSSEAAADEEAERLKAAMDNA